MQFFHGSIKKLANKTVLKPNKKGYVQKNELEILIESVRPDHCISRFDSVFLCNNPDDIDCCGGYTDHIYIVQPRCIPQKSDLAWYTECQLLLEENNIEAAKNAAINYWNGIIFHDTSSSVFEYRCEQATLLEEFFD